MLSGRSAPTSFVCRRRGGRPSRSSAASDMSTSSFSVQSDHPLALRAPVRRLPSLYPKKYRKSTTWNRHHCRSGAQGRSQVPTVRNYVGGRFTDGDTRLDVVNPSDGSPLFARAAFQRPPTSMPPSDRGECLRRLVQHSHQRARVQVFYRYRSLLSSTTSPGVARSSSGPGQRRPRRNGVAKRGPTDVLTRKSFTTKARRTRRAWVYSRALPRENNHDRRDDASAHDTAVSVHAASVPGPLPGGGAGASPSVRQPRPVHPVPRPADDRRGQDAVPLRRDRPAATSTPSPASSPSPSATATRKWSPRCAEQTAVCSTPPRSTCTPTWRCWRRNWPRTMPEGLDCHLLREQAAEANDLAVLMARAHTGNFDLISLRNGYHGGSPSSMGLTSHMHVEVQQHPGSAVHHALCPDPLPLALTGANAGRG